MLIYRNADLQDAHDALLLEIESVKKTLMDDDKLKKKARNIEKKTELKQNQVEVRI